MTVGWSSQCSHGQNLLQVSFKLILMGQWMRTHRDSIAAIARDSDDKPIGWLCKRCASIEDPPVLKALACRDVVPAKERGFSKIILEGNSLSVIQALQGFQCNLAIKGCI